MSNILLAKDNCLFFDELIFGKVHAPLGKADELSAVAGIKDLSEAVKEVPWLGSKSMEYVLEPRLKLGTELPAEEMKKVLATAVLFTYEVSFMIEYSVAEKKWRFRPTPQSGTGGSVQYEAKPTDDGYYNVGTIHTHPDMGAFFSSIDDAMMKRYGGLFIVVGTRKGGKPTDAKCCFVGKYVGLDGREATVKFEIPFEELFPGLDIAGDYEPVEEWKKTIEEQAYKHPPAVYQYSRWPGHTAPAHGYEWDVWPYEGATTYNKSWYRSVYESQRSWTSSAQRSGTPQGFYKDPRTDMYRWGADNPKERKEKYRQECLEAPRPQGNHEPPGTGPGAPAYGEAATPWYADEMEVYYDQAYRGAVEEILALAIKAVIQANDQGILCLAECLKNVLSAEDCDALVYELALYDGALPLDALDDREEECQDAPKSRQQQQQQQGPEVME
jgi:hypothetical protein